MIKASKRLISILICLTLVLAMLPMAVFAADTVTVYYYNATNWEKVAVHYWETAAGDTTWPGKTMENLGNGYWKLEVPADIGGIIFNNTTGAQTGDMTLPTDGKNCYTGSEWITYTGEEIEVVIDYYLRGSMNNWVATDANKMTDNGDGTYSITMDLAAGTYKYKGAIADWSWSCPSGEDAELVLEADDTVTFTMNPANNTIIYTLASGASNIEYFLRGDMNDWGADDTNLMTDNGDGTYSWTTFLTEGTYQFKAAVADWSWSCPAGANASIKLDCDSEVTFTLDVAANEIYAEGDGLGEVDPMEIEYIVAVGAGSGAFLNGEDWKIDSTTNIMTEAEGVYTITYTGVAAGDYLFKFAANGNWDNSWGTGCTVESGVECDAAINGENGTVAVAYDDSTVTLTLDITNMDIVTGEGAKCTVTVVAPENPGEDSGEGSGGAKPDPMQIEYIVAVGTGLGGFLNDITWDPAALENMMTENDGVYTITFDAVSAGTYEFKFAANGAWDYSWGNGGAVESGAECELYFDGGNCTIEITDDLADITLTLDLTNMDPVTGAGAKCIVAVEAIEDEPVVDDGTKDIKFQTKDNSLRLVTWVDSLDYKEIVFNVTIGGQTAAIPCTTVYSSINAGGLKLTDAAAVFNEDALYFVTYTINNIPASVTEFEVSVTWTDLEGNTRTSGTRIITL